jgi:hypothetical protein
MTPEDFAVGIDQYCMRKSAGPLRVENLH